MTYHVLSRIDLCRSIKLFGLEAMNGEISSNTLLEFALDLSRSLSSRDRYDRLLDRVRKVIPSDAVALLLREDVRLTPLAIQGLTSDTMGRRFAIEEHPRFDAICQSRLPVRFASNCGLPDPYDGLLLSQDGDLPVHSCMGLPLLMDEELIGVLTLDSLSPGVFEGIAERTLSLISAMAAATLNTALTLDRFERRVNHSQQVLVALSRDSETRHEEMIGESDVIQQLNNDIAAVASSDFTVLVQGETGTGKELVARRLHRLSSRADQALVQINCAALPEHLIESELFGHVKGAFTGAERDRAGKFVLAHEGTLFLDEVGELPLVAQSKLLRALQSGEIQPVGQDRVERVDVRVIAATNRDLVVEVAEGRFRADLYHRLSVFPVTVPALRFRLGDIDLLAGFFLEQARRQLGIAQLKLSSACLQYFHQYSWPGNVRELAHVLNRAALRARIRGQGKNVTVIDVRDCGDSLNDLAAPLPVILDSPSVAGVLDLRAATERFQRDCILRVLTEEGGVWAAAARRLTMDRANLVRLAKRLSIDVKKTVSGPASRYEGKDSLAQ